MENITQEVASSCFNIKVKICKTSNEEVDKQYDKLGIKVYKFTALDKKKASKTIETVIPI